MTTSLLSGFLRRAWKGDEAAFTKVVEATRERLFWTVKRMVGRDALADEILQEAYMALWSMEGGTPPDNPEAWLRRTCINRALDHLRREETKARQAGEEALENLSAPVGLEETMGVLELEAALHRAISSLPGQERAAFVMKVIEGLEYPEVSAALGVSESTVRNQVMQARRKLERALAALGIEP
jgi:RNA polymerase sigma-70 factor (ECF subfamily)